jgi:hypothetical protein
MESPVHNILALRIWSVRMEGTTVFESVMSMPLQWRVAYITARTGLDCDKTNLVYTSNSPKTNLRHILM